MPELSRPDGTSIHYEVRGDGPALLLLAPGVVNSDIHAWEHRFPGLLDALARRYRIITLDQRYSGLSTGPNVPFDYATVAGDQMAVLDAAGVEDVAVVGAEIGANYALRLACDEPERTRAVLAIAPMAREGERAPAGYARFEETWRVMRAEGLEAVFQAARANPRFDDAPAGGPYAARFAADRAFVEDTRRKGRERYVSRVVRFRDGMFPPDRALFSVDDGELAACTTPIHGAPGESALFPATAADALASLAPNASVVPAPATIDDWLRAVDAIEKQ